MFIISRLRCAPPQRVHSHKGAKARISTNFWTLMTQIAQKNIATKRHPPKGEVSPKADKRLKIFFTAEIAETAKNLYHEDKKNTKNFFRHGCRRK